MKIKTKLAAILLSAAQAILFSACTRSEDLPKKTEAMEESIVITMEEITSALSESETAEEVIFTTEPPLEPVVVIHEKGAPTEPDKYGIVWGSGYGDDEKEILLAGTPMDLDKLVNHWDLSEDVQKVKSWLDDRDTGLDSEGSLSEIFEELNIPEFEELYFRAYAATGSLTFTDDSSIIIPNIKRGSEVRFVYDYDDVNDDKSYYSGIETGMSVDGFYNSMLEIFTPEFTKKRIEYSSLYAYDNRLYQAVGSRGGDLSVVHCEYELTEKTDTEIIITEVCYCRKDDDPDLTYYPEKKDEYDKDYINNKFVLTEKGWRCDFFSIDRPGMSGPGEETFKALMS